MATFLANQINSTWGDITGQTVHVQIMFPLRWLKTVPSTFQDVDFDGSLLALFIS